MSDEVIEKLALEKRPMGGGYYRETYRSEKNIMMDQGERPLSIAIYFYLDSDDFVAWHRLQADELWHFYSGTSITLHMINKEGVLSHARLGNPLNSDDEMPQVIVPAHTWFAAEVSCDNTYALVGCTMTPGLDFADIELGDRSVLAEQYPDCKDIVYRLTRTET